MAITLKGEIPLQDVSPFFGANRDCTVSVLRLDCLQPAVSGNKWFKLAENLAAARAGGFERVITFGGAYSNHLVATAVAAAAAGLAAVGVVRGLDARERPSPTLLTCVEWGMQLCFVERQAYRKKEDPLWLEGLTEQYGRAYMIPEGGANEAGRRGAEAMAAFIPASATHICLSVGTGTSLTGLRNALPARQEVIGFTAMKGGGYLKEVIRPHLHPGKDGNWQLQHAYHFGGFAKCGPELKSFIHTFYRDAGIPLDIVYTGKMMRGIGDLLEQGYFPHGAEIIAIHTGGLQGNPPGLFD